MSINTLSTNNEILSQLRKSVGGILVYQGTGETPVTTANTLSIFQVSNLTSPQEAGFSIIRVSFQVSLQPAGSANVIFSINGTLFVSQIYQINDFPTQIIAVYKVPTNLTPPNSSINVSMLSYTNFIVSTGSLINIDMITYIT